MKASFIVTVFNEEETITPFLRSVFNQTVLPDEIIIVDAGSTDNTLSKILNFKLQISDKKGIKIQVYTKKGNRSVGRNEAIKRATNEIIAISDAGNILDRRWLENIIKPFLEKKVDVVAGYSVGVAKNIFQKCLIPYVLVMPDKAKPQEFLPATRSMAIRKSAWKKAKGFDEKLSHNEDYAFARRLEKLGLKIHFAKDAITKWLPRTSLKSTFIMFFRFALGDIEAGILREKVAFIFLRYIFAFYILALSFVIHSTLLWATCGLFSLVYLAWSVKKNYRYVSNWQAFYFLPILQIISDVAVISGSIVGLLSRVSLELIFKICKQNIGLIVTLVVYILVELSVINWGIPNVSMPFTYHMDEWHQSQAVRDVFKYGTPNMTGAANGTIFQFFLTGIYLIPFYVLHIVNPFAIKSSILNLDLQQRLFEVLRLNTLLFGTLSVILVYFIARRFFKSNGVISMLLFTITPVFLMLSNYFKYDVALIFWILLSLVFILEYVNKPKSLNFILASIFSALAFSVKVSAIPLLPILVVSYVFYTPFFYKKLKLLFVGLLIYIFTIIFFGIPDLIFGNGSLVLYLTSNLIISPLVLTNSLNLGINHWLYLFSRIYPITFGRALYSLSFISILVILLYGICKVKKYGFKKVINLYASQIILVILMLFFILSLYPLKLSAVGNRVLVLLPFFALLSGIVLERLLHKNILIKFFVVFILVIALLLQLSESYVYLKFKYEPDVRTISSNWIINNIKPGTEIGLENIPIYQGIPDVTLKEFYLSQYGFGRSNLYLYRVVGPNDNLPNVIIVTNDKMEENSYKKSAKNDLVKKLNDNHFKLTKRFQVNFSSQLDLRSRFDLIYTGLLPIVDSISIYRRS
jgi:glycosyltransferase involved in cell wall biosynthesis